ncbi:organomercurial lyase [Natrinema salsiterrestre]|uniref:Alkylmercury lyase family protein n=1 Tax=Natrinema salsiterrestre TaxID=2950540 RepID=A0A9Q4L0I8_9EURY|nr:organomercurial lyase [Natrinema salsiterrestre]MDF9747730.1 alkylmercury lyase family protein [Natrinema salsiterrestre]
MRDQTCECCGTVANLPADAESESESTVDRWLGDASVMETSLPDDVRTAMTAFFGGASITTLEEWVTELRRQTGGGPIGIEELCHADGETDHWGELDGARYDFKCFYDAVALAELAARPVAIHTRSPDGTAIEARATGTGDLIATPSTAAVSFGIATDEPLPDGEPTLEAAYEMICPVVNAFPTREAYEQWAARIPAATVGMPLSVATVVATGLVEE